MNGFFHNGLPGNSRRSTHDPGEPGRRALFPLCALLILFSVPLLAQEAIPPDSLATYEVVEIAFEGNEFLSGGTLKDNITSKETASGFAKFLHRNSWGAFGSPPVLFDPVDFLNDQERLTDLYHTRGFYNVTVTEDYIADSASASIHLHFKIVEGPRSNIDAVIYGGLDSVAQELLSIIFSKSLLKRGDPYESSVASSEISRVLNLLQNNGYPNARFVDERASASRFLSSNNFELRLTFETGKRYTFGPIQVKVDPPRDDITDNLALRHLDFKTGDLYSREQRLSSERNLNRLDLFEAARIDNQAVPETSLVSAIPMEVTVRPQARNEVAPELIASDENGAFNLGLGIGYTNRNFFGDGRTFNTRVQARSQTILEIFSGTNLKDTSIIGYADLEFRLSQPYLFARNVSGYWVTSLGLEKQAFYLLSILRNRIGSTIQLSQSMVGIAEWTLERVNPETLSVASQPDSVYAQLRDEDQPQFNSIVTLTWQLDRSNGILSPSQGNVLTLLVEESGILPKLFPGIWGGLPFTQYYKASVYSRWYNDLTNRRFNILALKLKAGYQEKYGASKYSSVEIPLNRRFFGGGSTSVRGWKSRELGAMPSELLEFGGNFMLEGSAEMRVNHFSKGGKFLGLDLASIWGVYFLDVGNVWSEIDDFQWKWMAVAAGLGFRYETLFGPFRLDFGVKVYDPAAEPGRQWVFDRKFFGETLGGGAFHFGIGHTY